MKVSWLEIDKGEVVGPVAVLWCFLAPRGTKTIGRRTRRDTNPMQPTSDEPHYRILPVVSIPHLAVANNTQCVPQDH